MNSSDFLNYSKATFKQVCKDLNISEEEGRKYETEINIGFTAKFKYSFYEYFFMTTSATEWTGAGLYIKSLGRSVAVSNNVTFSGSYFTHLFYKVLEGKPEYKTVLVNIEKVEYYIPKIWTLKNIKYAKVSKEALTKKSRDIDKTNDELDKKFPKGFGVQLSQYGNGRLISLDIPTEESKEAIKTANVTGMCLALVSKTKDIITWKWDIKKYATCLDLDIIFPTIPSRHRKPELILDLQDFINLCIFMAAIFNLDHVEMFKFMDEGDVEEQPLMGIRDIEYL